MKKVRRTFNEVKEALIPIKEFKNGNEFLTVCPICDTDGKAHLSVKRDGEDAIIHCIKCDATNEEILPMIFPIDKKQNTDDEIKKLREARKKFIEEKKKEHQNIKENYEMRLVAEYQYKDINGELVFTKQKFNYYDKSTGEILKKSSGKVKKAFKVIDKNGNYKMPKSQGKAIVNIYNLDKLADANNEELIFIVEGEKDCNTLRDLGYTAISTYAGAGGNKKVDFTIDEKKLLKEHRENLILIPDNDDAGESYIEIWKEFNPLVFKLSEVWTDIPRGGDISDYLKADMDFKQLIDEINNLKEKESENILPISFIVDEIEYTIDLEGIKRTQENARGKIKKDKICSEPIIIEKSYFNNETNDFFYVLKFWFNNKWEEVIINSKILKSNSKIINIDGRLEINTNNAKNLIKYFDDFINYFEIKTKKCRRISSKLFIDEENKFVGYGSKIKFNNPLSTALEPKGNWLKWKSAASDIWKNGSLIEVFEFAKLGISLCVNVMRDLTPIFELVGKTGIGKTVLMQNRISMYGNPNKGEGIFNSGNTTIKALDKLLEQVGFLPAEIDEGELLRNSKELKDDDGFSSFIYGVSEGISRNRLQKDKNTDDYQLNEKKSWNTILNLTCESSLLKDTSGKGIINRVITINTKEEDLTLSLKHYNTLKENYGWFIRELEKSNYFNKKDIGTFINNKKRFAAIPGFDTIANKQQKCFKYFTYTFLVFNEILGERDYYIDQFVPFFNKQTDLEMIDKYIEDIYNLIYSRQQKFFDRTDPELQLKTISTGEIWGVITNNFIFIDKTKLEDFFNKKYRISFKSISKELEEKGVIQRYKAGKTTRLAKAYRYNNFSFNAVKIVRNSFDSIDLENE